MKYVKMLGLLAIAAAALMAFAGTASATLTSPAGTKFSGTLTATASSSVALDGAVDVSCFFSTVEMKPSAAGATSGVISALSFTNCGNDTVSVLSKGSLSISSAGTVTSTGAEITVQLHRVIFFVPITTHCIYKTNNTDVGTLTEGAAPARLHITGNPIPQVATDGACDSAEWTGTYTVNIPVGAITVD